MAKLFFAALCCLALASCSSSSPSTSTANGSVENTGNSAEGQNVSTNFEPFKPTGPIQAVENVSGCVTYDEPSDITISFDNAALSLNILDAIDLNGDCIDDFVLSAMVDPDPQVGYQCCNVPADEVPNIIGNIPILIYSTPQGYQATYFPEETRTHRTWAGKFLENSQGQYFVFGKNGEMGVPGQNLGEQSLIVKLDVSGERVTFGAITTIPGRSITTSIQVIDLDGDGMPEIIENNYNPFSTETTDSRIFSFDGTNISFYSDLPSGLEGSIPYNTIRIDDLNNDGELDLLAAPEPSFDGSKIGSFVVYSAFSNPVRENLSPPAFGTDHYAWDIEPLEVDGLVFVFETSTKAFSAGDLDKFKLSIHQMNNTTGELEDVSNTIVDQQLRLRGGSQEMLETADLDLDGELEFYSRMYTTNKPFYYDWDGEMFRAVTVDTGNIYSPGFHGTSHLFANPKNNCLYALTTRDWIGSGGKEATMNISGCFQI